MNTAAINRPELVAEIADRFGNQVLVLSVDARRAPGTDSGFEVTTTAAGAAPGSTPSPGPAGRPSWGRRDPAQRDGRRRHPGRLRPRPDPAVRAEVWVPVIASGGAGRVEHFPPAVEAGADAVLAATVFHFGTLRIGDVKRSLADAGHPVR